MGHYAAFILPAYGLTGIVLIGAVVETLLRARRWRRAAEREGASARGRKP